MMNTFLLEVWKEINQHTRHWETCLFDNAKSHFTAISLCFAAAGAVMAWSTVAQLHKLTIVICFLLLACALSFFAARAVESQKNYLRGFYNRRREIESGNQMLMLKHDTNTSSKISKNADEDWRTTIPLLRKGFQSTFILAFAFILLAAVAFWAEEKRSLLAGAKLTGADLSALTGLTQHDLTGACGDETTKLPANLTLERCR